MVINNCVLYALSYCFFIAFIYIYYELMFIIMNYANFCQPLNFLLYCVCHNNHFYSPFNSDKNHIHVNRN